MVGRFLLVLACTMGLCSSALAQEEVRLKDLGRFLGWRDNMLVGYGIVTGLAGSGDSPRSRITRQALSNALAQLGMSVPQDEVESRNVAAVVVSATLPPTANVGDKIDITVTSIGDARSLAGGALFMTPLLGPDHRAYALAQGAITVGGYRFDANQNLQQKNYPTVGLIPGGGTVETPVVANLIAKGGYVTFILKDPDVTTSERIAEEINTSFKTPIATSRDATAVQIQFPVQVAGLNRFIARIEDLTITPDQRARVVINERTGTVVAGGNVQVSAVSIAQGDIKVSVTTEVSASQPSFLGESGRGTRSLVISNSNLAVTEGNQDAVARFPNTTVADLVQGLSNLHVGTRDIIAILQAIKTAGALYADIIVQ